jgi:phosphatidylglycerol:prolipoprotein diacylglycerol transferase
MTFIHNLDPVLLNLGFAQIKWYGLMYVVAFLVTYFFVRAAVKQKKFGKKLTLDDVDTLMLLLVVGLIVGARLFEVLFYNSAFYFSHPAEIIAVWHGGLSFHGGLLGMLLMTWLFCRKKKISLLALADVLIVPLAVGQALGRVGNFINAELVGRITTLPWGMNFGGEVNAAGNSVFRHPSQLYEVFYNLVIVSILFTIRNKKLPKGYLFAWFLTLYSVFRFFNEFVREPEVMVGPLTLGQLLNIPMFAAGVWLLWKLKKNK